MSRRLSIALALGRVRLPFSLLVAVVGLLLTGGSAHAIPPSNDNFANAWDVDAGGIYVVPTGDATTEAGEPAPSCPPSYGHSVWFNFTPQESNSFAIDTLDSDFDTVLAVYTGASLPTLTEVKCNDDFDSPLVLQSLVRLNATGGTTYHIQASGWADASGSLDLNITELPFPVNTTADHDDGACDPIVSGDCTLREAINDSNSLPFKQTIRFDIGAGGVQTIQPGSELPHLTDPVVIDGTTQPGFAGSPIIEIDGTNAGFVDGLTISGGDSTVRSLVINRFGVGGFLAVSAISLEDAGGNVVAGNFLGTDVTGTVDLGNQGRGVVTLASNNNTIGGTTTDDRNLISGNNERGVLLFDNGNVVQGNYIGTDITGTQPLGNDGDGVHIQNGSGNLVGGVEPGLGNVISGNHWSGIEIFGQAALDNIVMGNYIGTSESGEHAIGNGFAAAAGPSGGPQAPGDGILLDPDSTAGPQGTIIGGPSAGMRNVVSGNAGAGIRIIGNGVTDTTVQGNYVGTNAAGTSAIGNTEGIVIDDASGNTIGGEAPGEGNVISGNAFSGIALSQPGAAANVIQGNRIGPGADSTEIGNGLFGIIASESGPNLIGGEDPVAGNTIAYNGDAGVAVFFFPPASISKAILSNSIHSNGGLGIDLEGDGVTPNDHLDPDTGGNALQNFPVLAGAESDGESTFLDAVTLDSTPSTMFRFEFFANQSCDASGYGEGAEFIGWTTSMTDGNGAADFNISFGGVNVPDGWFLTATATDDNNNTSEFSACVEVTGPSPTQTPTPTPTPTPPSESPTPTTSATPTVTPTGSPPSGESVIWGDANCSGSADPIDSLLTLRHDAGLSANTGDCPKMGQVVDVQNASPHPWGDVDCGGEITPVDSLKLLRYDAGLSVTQAEGCPELGSQVSVTA